jgi:ribosomal subunit interface protein
MERSDEIETAVREKAAKLEEFYDRITSCHVAVEAAHCRHHTGNLYRVRIHLAVPRRDLAVNWPSDEHHAAEDVFVAIRDAFDAMRRQLENYARELRGDVKRHAASEVAE